MESQVSDEECFILKAKKYFAQDPYRAKSLIITAQTLFPNHFGVQFEAYQIEKADKDVKKAAKYFSAIINTFKQPPIELWEEIAAITSALRSPKECMRPRQEFLSEMFQNLSEEVQHKLLMLTADHSEDSLEHCKLLLLLINKFPNTISTYGPSLVETLLSADRRGAESQSGWMELLIEEVTPLIYNAQPGAIQIPADMLYLMFGKSLEYYMNRLSANIKQDPSINTNIWVKVFGILDMLGKQLGWEPSLTSLSSTWSKEITYSKLMQSLCEKKIPVDDKMVLFCATTLFLHTLHEYTSNLNATINGVVVGTTLIEIFRDHPSERTRMDVLDIEITIEKNGVLKESTSLKMCIKTWDLLQTESLRREFHKLLSSLSVEEWVDCFLIDMSLYQDLYSDTILSLQPPNNSLLPMCRYLKLVSLYFKYLQYSMCFKHILTALASLPPALRTPFTPAFGTEIKQSACRHFHFMPLTRTHIVQYCARILSSILKQKLVGLSDIGLGHLLVLMQMEQLQESATYAAIFQTIQEKRTFQYPLFQKYITNISVLEEIVYLSTEQGGAVVFDIFPTIQQNIGQRRIGTRHADKGVKEDFKQNMKSQLSRQDEPIENVIVQFIRDERKQIMQFLI